MTDFLLDFSGSRDNLKQLNQSYFGKITLS